MYHLSGILGPNRHEMHEVWGSELDTNYLVFEVRSMCEVKCLGYRVKHV